MVKRKKDTREFYSYQPVKHFMTPSGKKASYQYKEQFSKSGVYKWIKLTTNPENIRFDFNLAALKKKRRKMKWF